MVEPSDRRWTAVIASTIAIFASALYVQTLTFPFVYFDDDLYVFQNPVVSKGLTWKGIVWAFTSGHAANWHPLTWLSHMADVQLFGMAAGGHHATNVVFHGGNSALLYLLLNRVTGASGKSACVAVLFAIHPVNVESVAWVSERKNVLSTFFLLATMFAYARYVERPGVARYAHVFLGLTLGLMAKPMLVTLPFLLLLLDYWPLNRYGEQRSAQYLTRFTRLVYEKIPLFGLSAISCAATYVAQQRGQALDAMPPISLTARAANAALAYAGYLKHLVFPLHLSAIYPHPAEDFSRFGAIAAGILLCVLTAVSVWCIRRAPHAYVGWFWFLGSLVPVIGLVQVGYQAMADRYLYVPAIGIFAIAVWGVNALIEYQRVGQRFATGIAVVVFALLAVLCWRQTTYWRGTVPLFEHAIAVTGANAEAHNHLGYYYLTQDRPGDAIPHFEAARQDRPDLAATYTNWGAALRMQGDPAGAVEMYAEALRLNPGNPVPRTNIGIALLHLGRAEEARTHLEEAVERDPTSANAHAYLGVALIALGEPETAAQHVYKALELDPDHSQARAALDALTP